MAIMLHNVTACRENNSVAGQLVEQVPVGDLQCAPVEGAEWKCGRYGRAIEVALERSVAGLPRGPWVLKAAAPENPGEAETARDCLVWERGALAGQNRTPFLPGLAASGELSDGTPFLLMSPVEGRTLREALKEDPASLAPEPPEGGPLAEEAREALAAMRGKRRLPVVTAVREVALPLAEGLAGLEERRFCHGDVSPSNVVLGEDGSVRMVDLGCLGSLGEEPRGKGTAPYVLPGWDKAPGGRPRDCRGVDAYALAVLLREMTGPADDLVPPAIECAWACSRAAAPEGEGAALFAPMAYGGESDAPVAYFAVATELDRRFRVGLGQFVAMLEERFPVREEEYENNSDDLFDADCGPAEYLRRVLLAYVGWWESDVWSILRQVAIAGVPALTFHRYVDVEAGVRSFSAPWTLLAAVEAIFRQGGARWLERSPWDAGRSEAARLKRSDILCDRATALFLKDPDGNRSQTLELLLLAAEEGRREFKAHVLALAARVGLPLAERSKNSALRCARWALEALEDGVMGEDLWNAAYSLYAAVSLIWFPHEDSSAASEIAKSAVPLLMTAGKLDKPVRMCASFLAAAACAEGCDVESEESNAMLGIGSVLGDMELTTLRAVLIGRGDSGKSKSYWEQAAMFGSAIAVEMLARSAKSQKDTRIRALWKKAAELGSVEAMAVCSRLEEEEGDPQSAREYLKGAARGGHVESMRRLADAIEASEPMEARRLREDAGRLEEAVGLFIEALEEEDEDPLGALAKCSRAAKMGSDQALLYVMMKTNGCDYHLGLNLLERASSAGDVSAMFFYAVQIEAESPDEAHQLFLRAAELGDAPSAQWLLDSCSNVSIGKEQDYCKSLADRLSLAKRLFDLAKVVFTSGIDYPLTSWCKAAGIHDKLFDESTEDDVNEDNKARARALWKKAAQLGSVEAMAVCSRLEEEEGDPQSAREYLKGAARGGHVESMRRLADAIEASEPMEARRLREDAGRLEEAASMCQLGNVVTGGVPHHAEFSWGSAPLFWKANILDMAARRVVYVDRTCAFALWNHALKLYVAAASDKESGLLDIAESIMEGSPSRFATVWSRMCDPGDQRAMEEMAAIIEDSDPVCARLLRCRSVELGAAKSMTNAEVANKEFGAPGPCWYRNVTT